MTRASRTHAGVAVAALVSVAAEARDDDWPEAWYQPPKTANELGIPRFSQSPYLDDRDLPPVLERLPDDPV
ncbi:MAG: hypothetical protein OXG44_04930, partial [Gammaproteobacteria bacterium]|nr:hypothetical protein [Gammaproteobacteria bacterium]